MKTLLFLSLAMLALAPDALAQIPKPDNGPPWWGNADNDTVSLFWNFDSAAAPAAPTFVVVPSWFQPPTGPLVTTSPGITWTQTSSNGTGAFRLAGTGTGTISALVDNDPRPYWIKIFFMQFDSNGNTGKVLAEIEKDLAKYERAIISESSVALPNGWTRTTMSMYLIPQPIDETATWSLEETAGGTVELDNVFLNSKCVKPPPDEEGKALGEIDTASLNIDLLQATGASCTAVAATEDQLTGVVTFWVAGRTANADQVFRLNQAGAVIGPATPLPTATASVDGASDLATGEVQVGAQRRTTVFGVLDRRATAAGAIDIVAIDAATAAVATARSFTFSNPLIAPGRLGLAFSPHGDAGNGSLWISDQAGGLFEIDLAGAPLQQLPPGLHNLPSGLSGLGYDDKTNQFYLFSETPRALPAGVTTANGFVFDGYTQQPTGIEFFGDLALSGPGLNLGGRARGIEVLRRQNGDFKLLCVQQLLNGRSRLTVLNGPYQYGWSLLGRCGMRNGPPMEGRTFEVTLRGVPRATFAMMFLGVDNTQSGGFQLPLPLAPIGLEESRLLIDPLQSGGILPVLNGNCTNPIAVPPPGVGLRGLPLFFQWLVFDPTVQLGMACSQGGETVIY